MTQEWRHLVLVKVFLTCDLQAEARCLWHALFVKCFTAAPTSGFSITSFDIHVHFLSLGSNSYETIDSIKRTTTVWFIATVE